MHNTVAGAKLLEMSHSAGVDTVISFLASLCTYLEAFLFQSTKSGEESI